MRKPRILILGLPYFGRMLAGLLGERGWDAAFADHPGRDVRGWARVVRQVAGADVVYLIGSRADVGSPQERLLQVRRKPLVIHWVGTDVQIAAEEQGRGRLSGRVVRQPVHWCDAPWLVEEAEALGMRAEYVALPVPGLAKDSPPLPERFGVILYLPVDAFDREVFDMETLLRLPGEFPDVRFTLIPSTAETLDRAMPGNVEMPGWVGDMDGLYRETTAYVRLTSHDGMSFMALEAMSRGRYVVWPFPVPGVTQASGYEGVRAALAGLLAKHEEGTLGLNTEGMGWVRERFVGEEVVSGLDRRLRALL